MQSLQARIDSFQKTKRIKRHPNKSSPTTSVKWPHPSDFKANPNTLAEAGFYFNPSWDDRDSVACFLCGKELSEWDATDDPFEIHYTKCRSSCAWAAVRCGLAEDMDEKGRYGICVLLAFGVLISRHSFVFADKTRLPHSKVMKDARLATFGQDWWPHDAEPDHAATSTKVDRHAFHFSKLIVIQMAQAGFVYTPQVAGDDTVTCLYCNLSLGGWEKEDDPVQEHRSRDSKSGAACPFRAFSSKDTRSKPAKTSSRVEEREQSSSDELAAARTTDDPPPARPKRGKARSTTTTASSKSRRKTKTTRGKSAKSSILVSRRSQSPSGVVLEKPEDSVVPNASTDVNISPTDAPEHDATPEPPRNSDSHRASTTRTNDGHVSPPNPQTPTRHATPLQVATALNHPDPIISMSPAGQPILANTQFLTQDERMMSLEQWIRHEISLSSDKLLTDGQRWIDLFKTRAAEVRKCIDEL
ncbi:hypothetical protein JVU11DRAFT_7892 [Chiua virens]|nr:hypothetical protein JVU11DRAFT_7892 [Chiua virens]